MAELKKIPRLRVVKGNKRTNRRLIFLLCIFFMLLFMILFFRSSFGKVQNITIKGNQWTSTTDIMKKAGIKQGASLLFIKKDKVEQALISSYPVIQKISLQKDYPSTLEIQITENPVVVTLQTGGKDYPVFQNGIVLTTRPLSEQKGDKPRLSSWNNLDLLPTFIQEYNRLDSGVKLMISEVVFTGGVNHPDSLTLYMKEGYEVHTKIQEFAKNMAWYPSFVKTLKNEGNNKGIIYLSEVKYFEPIQKQ